MTCSLQFSPAGPRPRLARHLLALLLGLMTPLVTLGQGYSPDQAVKRMTLADGLAVDVMAAEPDIRQPLAMQFDHRGRMWVIQYLQYPTPAGLKAVKVDRYLRTVYDRVPEPPPKGPKGIDRITICEDTNGDGKFDSFKNFVDDLNLTTGLALSRDGVYVAQAPYLLFYPDKNHDDKPDGPPKVLLKGFGMEDAHATANSLMWGPDGWLYGAQGSTVTAHIRGQTFQQGIWRYHPPTDRFELFAEGGGNTWGVDFDATGRLFASTNHGKTCGLHQVQGAYYVKNFGKHGALQNPYAFGYFEHIQLLGKFRGGHVTIGGLVYQADALPKYLHQQFIGANILANEIYWYDIKPKGSTYTCKHGGELLIANDSWFRPVDCTAGPDGAVYIADWYDKRANHVDPKDDWDKTNGRIYRLRSTNAKPIKKFDLWKKSDLELIDLMNHPNDWYVRQARQILREKGNVSKAGLAKLLEMLRSDDEAKALNGLWTLYTLGNWHENRGRALLEDKKPAVRRWAVRLLGDAQKVEPQTAQALTKLAQTETDPTVRAQLACSAKRLPADQALPIIVALWKNGDDSNDTFLPLLSWWTLEDNVNQHTDLVLKLFQDKALWTKPVVKKFIIERLARRFAAPATDQSLAAGTKFYNLAPTDADRQLIETGFAQGWDGQKWPEVPKPLQSLVQQWKKDSHNNLGRLQMLVRLGDPQAGDLALNFIRDSKKPRAQRQELVETLAQVGRPQWSGPLLELLPTAEVNMQKTLLTALSRFDDPVVADQLLDSYSKLPSKLRWQVRDVLGGRKNWSIKLLEKVDAGQIKPEDFAVPQLQAIALHDDKKIKSLLTKHWGKIAEPTAGERRARVHGIAVSLKLAKGDPHNGKVLFKKQCALCHKLFGEGEKVGPELTGTDRKNRTFLLTSIVDPSSVIRKQYIAHVVATADGQVLTGLIAEQTPTKVVLINNQGKKITLPTDDIEDMQPSPKSIMPEGILDKMTPQEVRDLMAYLELREPLPADSSNSKPPKTR